MVVQAPAYPQTTVHENHFVPIEVDRKAEAYAFAQRAILVNNPGMAGAFNLLESVANQFLSGQRKQVI